MSVELLEGHLVGFPGVFCHPIERHTMKKAIGNASECGYVKRHSIEAQSIKNPRCGDVHYIGVVIDIGSVLVVYVCSCRGLVLCVL